MLMRAIAAVTLMLSMGSGANAGARHGVTHRMSCSEVRYYVAKYSATTEMYARSHGVAEAQIDAARRCLKDQSVQTAQRSRWYSNEPGNPRAHSLGAGLARIR
jgi:hypothetical protein